MFLNVDTRAACVLLLKKDSLKKLHVKDLQCNQSESDPWHMPIVVVSSAILWIKCFHCHLYSQNVGLSGGGRVERTLLNFISARQDSNMERFWDPTPKSNTYDLIHVQFFLVMEMCFVIFCLRNKTYTSKGILQAFILHFKILLYSMGQLINECANYSVKFLLPFPLFSCSI